MAEEPCKRSIEDAIASLLRAQEALAQKLERDLAELKEENAERFARIETLLLRHEQLLAALPEAIWE
jgi:hypothetical protein